MRLFCIQPSSLSVHLVITLIELNICYYITSISNDMNLPLFPLMCRNESGKDCTSWRSYFLVDAS